MFTKLLLLAALAVYTSAEQHGAAQYPAGVDPQSCPNYPNCDNAVLHSGAAAAAGAPAWGAAGAHQWESSAQAGWSSPALPVASAAAGAQYPAGVNPQSCPNYPNCDNAVLHDGAPAGVGAWGVPAAPAWNHDAADRWDSQTVPAAGAQYPAGVDPKNCPNYPNCDNAVLHGSAPAGAGAWGVPVAPAWNPAPSGQWGAPAAPAAAAPQYPAGVNPHSCPNYPYCQTAK